MKQRLINKKLNKDCLFQLWYKHYIECVNIIVLGPDELSIIRRGLNRKLKLYISSQLYLYTYRKLNIKPTQVKKYFDKYFLYKYWND